MQNSRTRTISLTLMMKLQSSLSKVHPSTLYLDAYWISLQDTMALIRTWCPEWVLFGRMGYFWPDQERRATKMKKAGGKRRTWKQTLVIKEFVLS